jgi:hypothetical protein
MASTYVNDLRLNELGTGDGSGTWGTTTNTNLELIAEGLSFGTEAITTNADTHTSTVADGATDPARSIYIKYTGTLDSACTITIAPNTLSRLHFIENGTSGSQNIIISQGSGANVTIPPGDVKVVYLDGAGSGAAVVDAFASLSVVDLKVQDDLTVTDDLIVNGDIDLEGSIDVNGTANLDVVDIDGAVDMASTLQVDGAITSSSGATITTAGNTAQLKLESTDADANVGPILEMTRNSSSPADNDILARIDFKGDNDAAEETFFGSINAVATDVSDGAEDAQIKHRVMVNGTVTSMLDLDASGATFGGNIVMPDNAKALFGASSDLQIYHDGSNSIVYEGGTGTLKLATAGGSVDIVKGSDSSETMAKFNINGAAELYHDNVKKIETTSSGVDITGGFTATAASTITTADNTTQLTLKSTDADANEGPILVLSRDNNSAADGDLVGTIKFNADRDDNNSEITYVEFQSDLVDASDGAESGGFAISSRVAGTSRSRIKASATETVFNEDSVDLDFRVESDSQMASFFIEGSTSNIGIGHNTPTADSALAGVTVPSGTKYVHIHDGDGAVLKLSDPSDGSNRGAQIALFNTHMVINNCESDHISFGTGNAERMRLSTGALRIGQSTTDVPGSSNTTAGIGLRTNGDAFFSDVDSDAIYGNRNNAGGVISIALSGVAKGGVAVASGGVTFNTTSDRRLKENIEPLEATDKLMEMNPVLFNWKDNPDGPKNMGFIAQDMQNIMPEAVSSDDTEEKMLRMDYGRITPVIVSALQDAHKKIEELESRIAAMESK